MSATVCTLDDEECKEGHQADWVKSTASSAVFAGAICGQLLMGYVSDIIGRNAALVFTLSLVSISALLSAVASVGSASAIYTVIIVARFFLGFGAGGVYPLSATKAAEDAGKGGGVDIIAASRAFFWQVPGSMAPWLLALIFSYSPNISSDTQWRLLLGLGAVPSVLVVILTAYELRLSQQLQQPDYKMIKGDLQDSILFDDEDNSGRISETSDNENKNYDATALLRDSESSTATTSLTWDIVKDLIATGGGWFIYDVAYCKNLFFLFFMVFLLLFILDGVNLFGGEIVSDINGTDDDNVSAMSSIQQVTLQELIGLSMGIPACLLTIYLLSYVSTKNLQIYGFLFIAFCFILLAGLYQGSNDSIALYSIYCILLFSLSFGPNVTTFILPAQTYPKKIRGTYNGISAACGKVGAIVGVYMFGPVSEATSYPVGKDSYYCLITVVNDLFFS